MMTNIFNLNLPIQKIMSTALIILQPKDSIRRATEMFTNYPVHHLLVMNEQEELLGIISKEDLRIYNYRLAMETTGKPFTKMEYSHTPVSRIMTKHPLTIAPEDDISLVAAIFKENKFHALPVVEDGKVVGIVTSHDLLAYAFGLSDRRIDS